jgi:hypothetical protein
MSKAVPDKAPEGWRSPRRFAPAQINVPRAASWTAAALRRFFGARLGEPQHDPRDSSRCGSQTRAPIHSSINPSIQPSSTFHPPSSNLAAARCSFPPRRAASWCSRHPRG